MTALPIETYSQYRDIVERYGKKSSSSNDYLQREAEGIIAEGRMAAYLEGENAYLFVSKDIGSRLYYYINDFELLPDFCQQGEMVTEILFRSGAYPEKEVAYFQKLGFQINLIRDQYAGSYRDMQPPNDMSGVFIEPASCLNEVAEGCTLFNQCFDALSGDYISPDAYADMLQKDSILVAKDRAQRFVGALHVDYVGKVANLSHLAVIPEARGQHVGQALLDAFVERCKGSDNQRYQLWVQRLNTPAVNLYKKKGFKFIGKSTLSLVQLNNSQRSWMITSTYGKD